MVNNLHPGPAFDTCITAISPVPSLSPRAHFYVTPSHSIVFILSFHDYLYLIFTDINSMPILIENGLDGDFDRGILEERATSDSAIQYTSQKVSIKRRSSLEAVHKELHTLLHSSGLPQ